MSESGIGKYGVMGGGEYFYEGRAAQVERLGFGAIWIGGSSPSDLAWIEDSLRQTQRLVVVSAIVNVWTAPASEVAEKYHEFEEKYPGRFLLGIGAGHPETSDKYQSPYQKVVSYLDELDELDVPKERRVLAALRSRMLGLARDRTAGAHPYFMPVEHTRFAREKLGPSSLLAPETKVVFETDIGKARAVGSLASRVELRLSNYVNAWLEFGFPELQVGSKPTGEFLDALVHRGTPAEIAAGLKQHLDAGADHVAVQVIPSDADPATGLAELAKELEL